MWLAGKLHGLNELHRVGNGDAFDDISSLRAEGEHDAANNLWQARKTKLALMTACGFYLAQFHHVLDTSGQILTDAQVLASQEAGNGFLTVWSKLARDAFDAGIANYKLRP